MRRHGVGAAGGARGTRAGRCGRLRSNARTSVRLSRATGATHHQADSRARRRCGMGRARSHVRQAALSVASRLWRCSAGTPRFALRCLGPVPMPLAVIGRAVPSPHRRGPCAPSAHTKCDEWASAAHWSSAMRRAGGMRWSPCPERCGPVLHVCFTFAGLHQPASSLRSPSEGVPVDTLSEKRLMYFLEVPEGELLRKQLLIHSCVAELD